jgi:hypothetical protein
MKIEFDNLGMSLHAKSMGKLFHITHLCTSENSHDKLFEKGLITVANMPELLLGDVQLLSQQYSGKNDITLEDKNTASEAFTGLYILSDNHYFQVANIVLCAKQGNGIMSSRDDISLIGSIEATQEVQTLHFLASNTKAKKH